MDSQTDHQRIAVISDVHANLEALGAVIQDIERCDVHGVWCLGDMVGRGSDPVKVVRRLKRLYDAQHPLHQSAWLTGNHDLMVLNRIPIIFFQTTINGSSINGAGMNSQVVEVALQHREMLQHDQPLTEWLGSFQSYADPMPGLFVAHGGYEYLDGTLNDTAFYGFYVQEDGDATTEFTSAMRANLNARLIVNGHTHRSRVWQWSNDDGRAVRLSTPEQSIYQLTNLADAPVIINVGSVGHPRGDDTDPTYAIISIPPSLDYVEVEFRKVPVSLVN